MKTPFFLNLTINALTFCFSLFLTTNCFASEKNLDSLLNKLNNTIEFVDKSKIHLEIAYYYWSANPDSAYFHIDKAEEFDLQSKISDNILSTRIIRGTLSFDLGNYDEALQIYQSVFEQTNENTDPVIIARIISNIGNCYSQKNDLSKAIESYRNALDYLNNNENTAEMAVIFGRLGNLYYLNRNYVEAIEYYKKAGFLFVNIGRKSGEAITFMNIGNCYKQLNAVDSAIVYYSKALKQFKSFGNMQLYEAQCLANLGNVHSEIQQRNKALKYLLSADSLFSIIQNPYSIAQIKTDLAYLYLELEKTNLAKYQIDKCLEISKKNGYDRFIETSYRLLWKYYDKLNDCDNAYTWLNKYFFFKDSIGIIARQEKIDMLLTQFETERKEKEIEILKQTEKINRLEIRRKTFIQYLTLFGLFVALSFIAFLYLNNQRRKRINFILSQQNVEINQQKEEITTQRDEIESQRNILQDQNLMLEQFRTHTTHSLRYAQSIQAAILPSEKVLQQISPEYFVLMKPCELVSGDFFWATSFDDYHVFCVADCTGHGVPGAFMSILGLTALNDIVARHRVTKPSDILGFLRESVIEALSQNDAEQLHKDGMDIGICIYNSKSRILQFAGARISIWLVSESDVKIDIETSLKNEFLIHDNYKLTEIKGNAMPVGISPKMVPFDAATIKLNKNTVSIYIITDGFADQQGGENCVKFGSSQLKKLILKNLDLDLNQQKEQLDLAYNSWKGDNYQIDDVTVLGIRL